MQEIQGQAKNVHEVLAEKYTVDFYQREYKWETKQIVELIDDLAVKFLEDYRPGQPREAVAGFGRYFLGSSSSARRTTPTTSSTVSSA